MSIALFQPLRSNSHPFGGVDEQPIKTKASNDIRHTLDTPNVEVSGLRGFSRRSARLQDYVSRSPERLCLGFKASSKITIGGTSS